jgi:hypothetical protein
MKKPFFYTENSVLAKWYTKVKSFALNGLPPLCIYFLAHFPKKKFDIERVMHLNFEK